LFIFVFLSNIIGNEVDLAFKASLVNFQAKDEEIFDSNLFFSQDLSLINLALNY
jgi:hypothetical protein